MDNINFENTSNTTEFDDIWAVLKNSIENEFLKISTQVSFNLWFGNLKLTFLNEEKACFEVKEQLYKNTIENKYLSYISNAMQRELGFVPKSIEITVNPSLANESQAEKVQPSAVKQAPPQHDEKETVAESENLVNFSNSEYRDYTFENFIVGDTNEFAHAASLNVAENPGNKINPLFIWGKAGVGKTHLMYAIANRAHQKNPNIRIKYIKALDYTEKIVNAMLIGQDKLALAHEEFRDVDILLIDDIQYMQNKDSTQDQFFFTFEYLHENNKQMVITSDKPPKDLTGITERLTSRFEKGVLADIKPPKYELRLAILKAKSEQANISFSDEVLDFLAKNITENIRQLEGAINKLSLISMMNGHKINTVAEVIQTIPDLLRETEPETATADRIIRSTARIFKVSEADLKGSSRVKNIKDARNAAMYVMRNNTTLSFDSIGKLFDRDASTVHSNVDAVREMMTTDNVFKASVDEIIRDIEG